jgi:hypothetical protein
MFYIAVGGKAGIPIIKKYDNTCESLTNTGFYERENAEYTEQEFMGFGRFDNRKTKGDIDLGIAFFASAEVGARLRFSNKALYIGAYLDYGLNNISNTNTLPIVEYNKSKPADFTVNSILNSQQNDKAFTDKVSPLAGGIKIRMAFGM